MYGMFRVFRFPSEQPDIVYTESLTSAYYLNKPDESAGYTEALDRMAPRPPHPNTPSPSCATIIKET